MTRTMRSAAGWSLIVCTLVWASVSAARAQSGSSTITGSSRAFNPAFSLNGLFLGLFIPDSEPESHLPHEDGDAHRHDAVEEGLQVQEVELRFTSDIDPYSKADATLAINEGEVELEEIFVVSNALPGGVGLRAGKLFVPFSVENTLHTHQLPFVERSLIGAGLFDGAYADTGLELRYLFPLDFFAELRGGVFDGADETFFDGPEGHDLVYHAGLSLLWDLGESSTFALDGGGVIGRNSVGEESVIKSMGGAFQWTPTRSSNPRRFKIRGEYFRADRNADTRIDEIGMEGWYSYVQFRSSRRVWVQLRHDEFYGQGNRLSLMLAFVPSEFQTLRLEFFDPEGERDKFGIQVQYNFTIGSHPAHRY